MKIAVYHDMPSGGGKRALYEIVKGLARRHTVDAYSLFTYREEFCDVRPFCNEYFSFSHARVEIKKKPFAYINPLLENVGLFNLEKTEKAIAEKIDSANYDAVLVSHGVYCKSPFVLRYLKTPHVYYCQEPWRHFYSDAPATATDSKTFKERFFRVLYAPYLKRLKTNDARNARAAMMVLVNSEFSRRAVAAAYGVSPEVCYLGVDEDVFKPVAVEKKNVVISVGRLHPLKGFDFLIDSIALIPAKVRPALRVVADTAPGNERRRLEKRAVDKNVVLDVHCNVSDGKLVELYCESLFAAYSPIREPFGFVPLEAGACGLPIVGVREGGVKETIVHGKTGFLSERDEGEFSRYMLTLLDDENARNAMGRAARKEITEKWPWKNTIDKIDGYFEKVISERPS